MMSKTKMITHDEARIALENSDFPDSWQKVVRYIDQQEEYMKLVHTPTQEEVCVEIEKCLNDNGIGARYEAQYEKETFTIIVKTKREFRKVDWEVYLLLFCKKYPHLLAMIGKFYEEEIK